MMAAMGFSSILTTTAAVLPKVLEAEAAFEQSKSLKRAANEQERLSNMQADAIEYSASENQKRMARNAQAELGHARVDAALSNTIQEGSTHQRELDLATRLQDDINAAANEQLSRANSVRQQGALDAWDLRNQARQSRAEGYGAVASGVGSLLSGLAKELGGQSGAGEKTAKDKAKAS